MEGLDRDLEYQADMLHEEGNLFGEVMPEEDNVDGCDDLDEYDGSRSCETGSTEDLVVHWHPVPMEDAAVSVASQVGHFLALRLAYGTASAHDIAQASSGR